MNLKTNNQRHSNAIMALLFLVAAVLSCSYKRRDGEGQQTCR